MCGLYGMVSFRGVLSRPEALEPMGQSLRHRGPDDRLLVVEPNVALGTERLRIEPSHLESQLLLAALLRQEQVQGPAHGLALRADTPRRRDMTRIDRKPVRGGANRRGQHRRAIQRAVMLERMQQRGK